MLNRLTHHGRDLCLGLLILACVPLAGCDPAGLGTDPLGGGHSDPRHLPQYGGNCRRYKVIQHPGHVVGYSPCRGNPLWVSYTASRDLAYKLPPRPDKFHSDPAAPAVRWHAYKGSGYERGHMAPNYAIARQFGPEAQRATFLMSNITPQRPNLNQKLWQRLEEVEIDEMARWHGEIQVIVGTVFDEKRDKLHSGVELPDAFFRIWLDERTWNGKPKALAFVVPQSVQGTEPLDQFVVSVDEVERLTGLDFFAELDDAEEGPLEAIVNTKDWKLGRVADQPPRY